MSTDRTVHILGPRCEIRDWLVSPVWSTPADDLGEVLDASGSPWDEPVRPGRWVLTNGPDVSPLKRVLYDRHRLSGEVPAGSPVDGGAVAYGEHTGTWSRRHAADGIVDHSEFCFTPTYRVTAAAAVLEVDQADRRRLVVASTGPWQAFLDGVLVGESDVVTYMEPAETGVWVDLPSRTSTLVVVTWQVAFREVRHILRVRVTGLPVRVVVPTPGAHEVPYASAERLLEAVGSVRWALHGGQALLTGPPGLALTVTYGRHRTRVVLGEGDTPVDVVGGSDEPDPDLLEDFFGPDDRLVVRLADPALSALSRELPVAQLPESYRGEPVGEPEQWRTEFLTHAVTVGGVGGELARLLLDPDAVVSAAGVARALWMVDNRADCADFEVVGLAHLLHRARHWEEGVREDVRRAVTGLRYWIDQPGLDAMCFFTENHQLVWHTAEILIGGLFPDDVFAATGWTGARHAEHGRRLALEWLRVRLPGGFAEFDSNAYLAIDTLAAVSLIELSGDPELAELCRRLADRILVGLAAHSWRGVHGSAHGRSYVGTLRSSRLEETAPIMWVCFGVGALNLAVLPTAVLLAARSYQVPEVARTIATSPLPESWGGIRHQGRYRFEHDLLARPYGSDTVVYRTPEVMLASVQDYRSGLPGLQEHIFGATLGPETQVYVTHPPNRSLSPSSRPNAWAGNRLLPRVRQERHALVALYRWGADDPEGRTHAWFPTRELDGWRTAGDWTVGWRGDGYVALWTAGGCRLTRTGGEAGQELVPYAAGRAWACCVGSAATDGSLDAFISALGTPESWEEPDGPAIAWEAPRLGRLELTWSGPFQREGVREGLTEDGTVALRPAWWGPSWQNVTAEGLDVVAGGHTYHLDLRADPA